jgi:hypothetical protein
MHALGVRDIPRRSVGMSVVEMGFVGAIGDGKCNR